MKQRFDRLRNDPRDTMSNALRRRSSHIPGPLGRRIEASHYVGTTSASGEIQFQILVLEGLRPDSRVLEIGCGALHASVPIIRFIDPEHFVGIDPNAWLREPHLKSRRLRKLVDQKKPRFLTRDDFDSSELQLQFDFILAHSILSHAAHRQLEPFLAKSAAALAPGGRVLASIRLAEGNDYGSSGSVDGEDSLDDTWIYPGVSYFKLSTVRAAAAHAGLVVEVKPQYTALLTARRPAEVHDWLLLTRASVDG
jgi:cyclopropane fatty-acyl-phospholipid synthase-like methyltransferase